MPCSKCFYPTAKLTSIPDGRQLCDLCLGSRIIQLDDRPTNDLRGSIMYVGNAILERLQSLAFQPSLESQHTKITYIKASDVCGIHNVRMQWSGDQLICPLCLHTLK